MTKEKERRARIVIKSLRVRLGDWHRACAGRSPAERRASSSGRASCCHDLLGDFIVVDISFELIQIQIVSDSYILSISVMPASKLTVPRG